MLYYIYAISAKITAVQNGRNKEKNSIKKNFGQKETTGNCGSYNRRVASLSKICGASEKGRR